MQFNRDASGKMTPLPKPSIDTGMGLERVVSIIQNAATNFDTDLIRPIIGETERLAERKFGESSSTDVAMKVIADHSRAAAFLIGDGILPANEGRGYVLRRILRRAIRYGRNIGLKRPFLHKTAGVVFDIMKPAYPELSEAAAFITNIIENEEIRFLETLDTGMRLLNDTLSEIKAGGETQVPGDVIFKLYDTYGFPVDIVRDVVRDENMSLDMAGFDHCMDEQRARSRSVATFATLGEAYRKLSTQGFKPQFRGYEMLTAESQVMLLVQDGTDIPEATAGQEIDLVSAETPFYAEAGGQVGDSGKITAKNFEMAVTDTIKDPTGIMIHRGKVISGKIKQGQKITLRVDGVKRAATALNHTATHILHAVLREVLGEHVKQAGSLVAPDRLRFDFTHFSQVDRATLTEIETLVNRRIRENVPTHTEEMEAEAAFKSGATALFEEKYGDRVRVVALSDFSKELCGGTHTSKTGDIGLFKIVSESSIASGVRRIEALTGEGALQYVQKTSRLLEDTAHLVKDKPETLPSKLQKMLGEHKALEKTIDRLKAQIASDSADIGGGAVESINDTNVLIQQVTVDNPAALRDLADRLKDKIKSGIVVMGSVNGPKAFLIVGVTKDLTDRFHAGDIIRQIAPIVGGGGGGRPDLAQAGGTRPAKLDQALKEAHKVISNS